MPLAFLTPLFLAGLALVAVPIWVHLRNRERKGAIEFPSLMFLRRIPYHSVRRQTIRNWPLFLLRAGAVALVAAAFARPFLDREDAAAAGATARARELVVLLDRSYSMGHGDRWPRALRAAEGAVASLGPGDRGSVVLFDAAPEALTQPTEDVAALRAALSAAKVGSGATRYAPAIRTARQLLAASDRPRREVLLLTDFQRGGWEGTNDATLPPGTTLTLVNVAEGRAENVAVTGVTTRRAAAASGVDRVAVSARVTRTGGAGAARTVPLTLELNDRALQTREVALDSSGAATVAFEPVPLPAGLSRAVVRAAPDALAADDAFYFTLAPGRAMKVLVLEAPGVPAGRSLFLRQALGVGDGAAFDVQVKPVTALSDADLAGRALVVLDDAPPGGQQARRLADFVRAGGGLLVALGDRSAGRAWAGDAAALLPATPEAVVDRLRDRGATLGFVDYAHPALSVFASPRSGDLGATRIYRYRAATPAPGAQVIARFDDGAAALVEKPLGRGRVLAWTSTFDNVWNDMPVQPVWVPFLHQLARHAGAWSEPRQWLTVGQVLDPTRDLAAAGEAERAAWVARAPAGGSEVIAAGGRRTLALAQQGFYLLRREGEAAGAARAVAVNLDVRESDLAAMDPEELRVSVLRPGGGATDARAAGDPAATPLERERRQSIWWWLLATALVVLATEAVLSNRRAMRRA